MHKQSTQLPFWLFLPQEFFNWALSLVPRDQQEATKNQSFWAFSIQRKILENLITNQMEWAISVLSDQNIIRDLLGRWSTLTSPVIPVGLSDLNVLFHLTKLLFPESLFCILFTSTITKCMVAWSGLCNWNIPFHWTHGILEISRGIILLYEKHPSFL